jgi:dihydrofolate reductase
MTRVVVSEFLTLDGVMQAPGGPDEDRVGDFRHGGWQMPYLDEVAGEAVTTGIEASGGFLLGRRTYQIFAAFWPDQPAEDPIAAALNGLPKHVASTTLEEPLKWSNSTLIRGDVAEAVAKLKQPPGKDLVVIGSGLLAQTLMQRDLVDEYQLMIHPVVLGTGKRLFGAGGGKIPLKLVDTKTTGTGVLILTYRRASTE